MPIILLVDFDYFYAQVEERDNPEYKGKPLVVCVYSGRSEDSGAVATCNYEAREFGIHSGMPIVFAKRKANEETVFLPVKKDYYVQVSSSVMDMMRGFAGKFEQVSVDEAYLDVSEKAKGSYQEAAKICREIKQEIRKQFDLTCSIGIGPNKLVAKMSAGLNKPDGMSIIRQEDFNKTFHGMNASKLHGIGPKMNEILEKNGVKTIGDLARFDTGKLKQLIGENKGQLLHDRANGTDNDPVEERVKQQISNLKTLKEDTMDLEKIKPMLHDLCVIVKKRIDERQIKFKTVSITTINPEIQAKTRSRTLENPSNSLEIIESVAQELLKGYMEETDGPIRRIGVGVSNFSEKLEKKHTGKKQPSLSTFFSK